PTSPCWLPTTATGRSRSRRTTSARGASTGRGGARPARASGSWQTTGGCPARAVTTSRASSPSSASWTARPTAEPLPRLAEQPGDDLLGEAVSLEEAPGARPRGGMAQAPALQEAPRPVVLALAGERFHHRCLDERFRQAARGEVGRDLEAARAARAQRPRPLARVGRVAHPAE